MAVLPKSEDEIASVIKECNRLGVRYMTVGNGSNLLVSDDGIDACVILLGKDFADVALIDGNTIFAQAGASLTKVCRTALENGLTGLEFAYGIPGSCGGGAFMNAGAYGGELKDVLVKCDHIDKNGEKGYYVCSDSWFDQYVFQAAVEKEYLGDLAKLAAQEPVVLEPWDPMGTLAD